MLWLSHAALSNTFAGPGDKDSKSLKDPSMPSPYPARARPPTCYPHALLHITINLCMLSTFFPPVEKNANTDILYHTASELEIHRSQLLSRADASHFIRSLTHTPERITHHSTNPDSNGKTPPGRFHSRHLALDGGHFPSQLFPRNTLDRNPCAEP